MDPGTTSPDAEPSARETAAERRDDAMERVQAVLEASQDVANRAVDALARRQPSAELGEVHEEVDFRLPLNETFDADDDPFDAKWLIGAARVRHAAACLYGEVTYVEQSVPKGQARCFAVRLVLYREH